MNDFVYIFPFFFIVLISSVLFVLSKKGWADLAKEYRFDGSFRGDRLGIISARINSVSYNNCLLFKYNAEGFYLRPIFIFRLFHKPLFIPWKAVKSVRNKRILFVNLKELVVGEPTIALIQIRTSTFAKIESKLFARGMPG